MAAYFHGSSEIHGDGLQTLYLMNPNYVGYSDTPPQPPPNMLLLNSSTGNSLNPASISHAPPVQTQHLVGIPLTGAATAMGSSHSDDPNRQSMHEIPAIPRFHYNLWGSVDQTPVAADSFIHRPPHTPVGVSDSDVGTHFGFRRPAVSPGKQGLSLSLSPQQSIYRSFPAGHDIPAMSPRTGDGTRGSGGSSSSVSAVSNGISGMQSMVLGSKYLQAAQELLDEVVDVGKAIKGISEDGSNMKLKNKESMGEASSGGTKREAELTTAERQELQMKKAKLVSMLDEVEQRYRQYHHQMQIVVTSFEQAAGLGSAKSYTSLALQTISKQFRCLKDAISEQIKATGKSLGEDDSIGGKVEGSRLKFVDHQLRQQRALQQLGMMQHNAWRPQRGLPERAVSVLRAWLFEHFLHPYPKDSDKHMLAKQTGLTRSQVSNWFINARVRLWKPMVEEMYLEEFKEQEQNASPENTTKPQTSKEPGFKSTAPQEIGTLQLDQINTLKPPHQQNPITQTASPTQISVAQTSPKKRRNDMQNSPSSILSVDMDMKPGERNSFSDEKLNRDGYHLLAGTASNSHGFGGYPMGELGRFSPDDFAAGFHGNGVSLTLGLPHCTQQNYLSTQNIQFGGRNEIGTMEAHYNGINNHPQASHSNNGYENINLQNRKRFATQLLHDFVA